MSRIIAFGLIALMVATAQAQNAANFSEYIDFRLVGSDMAATRPNIIQSDNASHTLVARIGYNESYLTTGWDYVEVRPSADLIGFNDQTKSELGYYGAGYAEGYVTADKIQLNARNILDLFMHVFNTGADPDSLLPPETNRFKAWVDDHIEYMTQRASGAATPFDAQLARLLRQLHGLKDGYNDKMAMAGRSGEPYGNMSFPEIFMLNFQEETWDVLTAVTGPQTKSVRASQGATDLVGAPTEREVVEELYSQFPNLGAASPGMRHRKGHCSALVKLTVDDILVAHDTWSDYNAMLRQYKTYVFETTITMSSYPGLIDSLDDWYMTSQHLAVQETTNMMYNATLLRDRLDNNTVSEFLRVMIANIKATDGASWLSYFETANSGTYNNQWMVVDMKKFRPGTAVAAPELQPGLFTVAEQIPGAVVSADMTTFLEQHTYWPSYNIPYFPEVYNITGNYMMFNESGGNPYYSYKGYARAEIFKAQHGSVNSTADMMWIMRNNDFETSQLSAIPDCDGCNPVNSPYLAIAARGDLVKRSGVNFGNVFEDIARDLKRRPFGAIDTKITSYKMMTSQRDHLEGIAVNGPSTGSDGSLPAFDWATAGFESANRYGMPDKFDFNWTTFDAEYVPVAPAPGGKDDDDDKKKKIIIIVVSCIAAVAVIGVVIILMVRKCGGSAKKKTTKVVDEGSPLM